VSPHTAIGFQDLIEARGFSQETLGSGGRFAAYVVDHSDVKANAERQELMVASGDGQSIRSVALPVGGRASSIQWFSDGRRFAFLLQGSGKGQVQAVDAESLQMKALTDEPGGVAQFALRPDGSSLAWIAEGRLRVQDLAGSSAPVTLGGPGLSAPRWHPDGRRIFVLRADVPPSATPSIVRWLDHPEPVQRLVSIDLSTRQERVWDTGTGLSLQAFEPGTGGGHVAFHAKTVGPSLEPGDPGRQSLRLLDLATGGVRELVPSWGGPGRAFFSFSPDGARLAFTAPPGNMRHGRLRVLDLGTGMVRHYMESADLNLRAMDWNETSDGLHFCTNMRLDRPWFALKTGDGTWSRIAPRPGTFVGRYVPASRAFLFTFADASRPPELYSATTSTLADPARWVKLSRANERLVTLPMPEARIVQWKSTDGREIEGLLHAPVGHRPGQPLPMIVQLNGARNDFHAFYQSYAPVLSARGYLVFQPNYRGLNGYYGESFLREGFHPNDVRDVFTADVLAGVEHLCAAGLADRNRLGLMGWSIGGSNADWVMVKTPIFKAVSSGAGSTDMVAMYAAGTYRAYYRLSWGASAFKAWDYYADHSSLKHMGQARTPTLFQVGENDEGVVSQCLESYNALREFGVPTELLVHKGEPHILQSPHSVLAKMLAEVHWFDQWIRGGPSWLTWNEEFKRIVGP
jgi:dipeptidyl aminopeptidase/acylaminoacyl peptidase